MSAKANSNTVTSIPVPAAPFSTGGRPMHSSSSGTNKQSSLPTAAAPLVSMREVAFAMHQRINSRRAPGTNIVSSDIRMAGNLSKINMM